VTGDRFGADLQHLGADGGSYVPWRPTRGHPHLGGGGVTLGAVWPGQLPAGDRARLAEAIRERLDGVRRQEARLANQPVHPASARHWDALVAYRKRLERALDDIASADRREQDEPRQIVMEDIP
jgi:hypothetical protein